MQDVYFNTGDVPDAVILRKRRVPHLAYRAARGLTRLLSGGKLGDSDFVLVLRKEGQAGI